MLDLDRVLAKTAITYRQSPWAYGLTASASSCGRGDRIALVIAAVAAFGLVATILAGVRFQRSAVPWLVGLYITAAYWFTASASFANPAGVRGGNVAISVTIYHNPGCGTSRNTLG
jgi:glycerol uptake facilitator-like aquaporin